MNRLPPEIREEIVSRYREILRQGHYLRLKRRIEDLFRSRKFTPRRFNYLSIIRRAIEQDMYNLFLAFCELFPEEFQEALDQACAYGRCRMITSLLKRGRPLDADRALRFAFSPNNKNKEETVKILLPYFKSRPKAVSIFYQDPEVVRLIQNYFPN